MMPVIALLAFNMMTSMFLTGKEIQTVYDINLKLQEKEQVEELEE